MHKHTRTTIALLVWLGITATGLAFGIVWLRDTPMSRLGQCFAGTIDAIIALALLIMLILLTVHIVDGDGKERK